MAFPTIPTVAAGRVITGVQADTTATRTFPSLTGLTKNSGDLLVAVIVCYQSSLTSAIFSSWGAGFTELKDIGVASQHCLGVAYKWSTGSETGTFTVAQAGTVTGHAAMIVLSIPGAHASEVPAILAALATGTTAAADPASLSPSWGGEDSLWIVIRGSGETGTGGSFTGLGNPPTNYGDSAQTGISADAVGGMEAGASFRQLNAASEDVGTGACDVSNARNCITVIAVRPVTIENHDGSVVGTGGGVVTSASTTNRQTSATETGGGVSVLAATTNRPAPIAATGAGVLTETETTDRSAAMTATGGGVVVFDYEASSGENHDATLAATGAGALVTSATTDRLGSATATASGVGTLAGQAGFSTSLTGTAGGVHESASSTQRLADLASTGGGVFTTTQLADRDSTLVGTGAGVLTWLQATGREASLVATGGGAATFEGTSAEDHTATLTATGGGVVSLSVLAARLAAALMTGGGVIGLVAQTDRLLMLQGTGGGIATFSTTEPGPSAGLPAIVYATITPIPTISAEIEEQ